MTYNGQELPLTHVETPDDLREAAARARRLAALLALEDDGRARLLEFADEMEARAEAIETKRPT